MRDNSMRIMLVMIMTIVAVGVCFGGEKKNDKNENDAIRSWAKVALLGQPEVAVTSVGASFGKEFPITFDFLTSKIDESNLPFVKVVQQDHGKFTLGKSVMGTPLQLGSMTYVHGLGTHSVSNIRVLLNKPSDLFTAEIGVNADTKVGTVVFIVEVGRKEVYRSGICKGGDAPVPVSIDLNKATEFTLRVLDGGDGPTCDWADWCNAKVVYTDTTSQWLDEMRVFSYESDNYIKTPSTELLPMWNKTHTVGISNDYMEIHNITYTDPKTGIKISCDIKLFKDYPAVEWVARFTNTGTKDTPIIDKILPLNMKLTVPDNEAILHHAQGSTCNGLVNTSTLTGYDFQPYDVQVKPNSASSFDSEGQSSTRWLPFYNLEWSGGGLMWAIGWSGRWQMDLIRDAGNNVVLKAGQKTLRTTLQPGESIRTPRMLLLQWRGEDRMRGHNQWRQLLLSHYLPRYKGALQMTPVAAENHLWSDGGGPKMNETSSLAWINKESEFGGEAFWLDAGWYCKGIWTEAFGTWDPHQSKFPNGLKVISDAAHAKGMKFIVWFYEQCVSPNSYIQNAQPQWVYNGIFDMSNPSARKWITDYISTRITDYGADVYRHDGGLSCLMVHDTPERQGITENHAIEEWYAHWDELLMRHPGLMIDNCAGGGQNIDLETIMRSLPLWQSDVECGRPNEVVSPSQLTMAQVQNAGLNLYVPLHATGVWGMDANPYWFRSAATTGVVFNENITDPAFNVAQAKKNVNELKSLRDLWLGDYYPLTDINLDETKWCAWQFYRPDLGKGFMVAFRRKFCGQSSLQMKLCGLDKNAEYKAIFVDEKRTQVMKGQDLENLTVTINTVATIMSSREAGVVLNATPKSTGISLRPEDGESQNKPLTVSGKEAWRSVKDGPSRMMYFVVDNPYFRNGKAANIKLVVEYFDEGKSDVRIIYDSSDNLVKVEPTTPGAWKEAGTFTLSDSKKWKIFECKVSDAFFRGRCNGADIRFEINGDVAPAIASLKLINMNPTAEESAMCQPASSLIVFEKL
jgi:alpha-galactosidase